MRRATDINSLLTRILLMKSSLILVNPTTEKEGMIDAEAEAVSDEEVVVDSVAREAKEDSSIEVIAVTVLIIRTMIESAPQAIDLMAKLKAKDVEASAASSMDSEAVAEVLFLQDPPEEEN